MKSYDSTVSGDARFIEALALNPAEDKVAVYARKDYNSNFEYGGYEGSFFVIRSEDGGYVTKKALKIAHSGNQNIAFMTSSDSMFFTSSGKVIMTWWLSMASPNSPNLAFFPNNCNSCSDSDRHDGHMRIAQFDLSSEKLEWYYEQIKYFGHSTTIAFGNWGENDIFLGGASDN